MSKTAKNLIIVLGLITVAAGGYFVFTQQTASVLTFETNDEVARNMEENSRLFIERRQAMQRIELDLEFFSDPRIATLRNFDGPIQEQPIGRDNPFRTLVPLSIDREAE
jgi:hypothetical protein